jgi:molybdenum cofactor cytidylyltransferase
MNREDKIACIVLAAGSSVRFGEAKQLAQLNGKSLVQTAIDVANASKVDYVFLVLGKSSSEILEKVDTGRTQVIFNKNYEQGISSSIRSGITNLPSDCGAAIIMVADQPLLQSRHLDLLIDESRKSSGKIIALSQNNEPRNPVLIPRALFHKLETLDGDEGARSIVRNSDAILIPVSDPLVFSDVDTKDSLLNLEDGAVR